MKTAPPAGDELAGLDVFLRDDARERSDHGAVPDLPVEERDRGVHRLLPRVERRHLRLRRLELALGHAVFRRGVVVLLLTRRALFEERIDPLVGLLDVFEIILGLPHRFGRGLPARPDLVDAREELPPLERELLHVENGERVPRRDGVPLVHGETENLPGRLRAHGDLGRLERPRAREALPRAARRSRKARRTEEPRMRQ